MKYLSITIAAILLTTHIHAQTTATTPQKAGPINIEFGNMKSEKPRLLSSAEYLKSQDNRSSYYASQFVAMMRQLKIVGVKNLTTTENQLIMSVPEPSEQAMALYIQSKNAATEKVEARSKAIADWVAQKKARKMEAAKLAEAKRQAEAKAQQEQEKIDAMNRQAKAQETMARQMQIQTQLDAQLDARMERYERW